MSAEIAVKGVSEVRVRSGGWGDELSAMSAAGPAGSMHEEEPSIAVAPGEVTLTAAVEIGFEFQPRAAPPEPG